MNTLVNLLNSQTKPFTHPLVVAYEQLVLSFLFAPEALVLVQNRSYQRSAMDLDVTYNLTLDNFTAWLNQSAEFRRIIPADEWQATKYLTTLETEIFQVFVKSEYRAPLQLRNAIMLRQFPAIPFKWEEEKGEIHTYKTIKAFYIRLHTMYQTRAWKLSYMMM